MILSSGNKITACWLSKPLTQVHSCILLVRKHNHLPNMMITLERADLGRLFSEGRGGIQEIKGSIFSSPFSFFSSLFFLSFSYFWGCERGITSSPTCKSAPERDSHNFHVSRFVIRNNLLFREVGNANEVRLESSLEDAVLQENNNPTMYASLTYSILKKSTKQPPMLNELWENF